MNIANTLKVSASQYHRNGMCGVGFYTMVISWEEVINLRQHAIATVSSRDFENYLKKAAGFEVVNPETRIIMFSPTGGVDIENTMRGDHFHEPLCEWLKSCPQERHSFPKK